MTKPKSNPPLSGIRPLGDRVLLKPIDPPEEVAKGVIIPQGVRMAIDSKRAEVIELGEGQVPGQEKPHNFRVKPGDVVVLPPHPGIPIKTSEGRFVVHRENDLVAIVSP